MSRIFATARRCLWIGGLVLFASFASFACAASPSVVTPDGGRYYGPLVDGKFNGKGRIEWDSGARYEGTFKNGLFSGRGRFVTPSGDVYEGEFVRGVRSGRGKLTMNATGASYEGELRAGAFNGHGRYATSDGEVYEGDFANGEFTGCGIYTNPAGQRHEGMFRNWRPDGPGTFTDGKGTVYEGDFADGQIRGKGRFVARDGARYEGELQGWQPHGLGELVGANGDVYRGSFLYGAFGGEGTLTYAVAQPDGRTQDSGVWVMGRLKQRQDEEVRQARAAVEQALYRQDSLLTSALAELAPRNASAINLYLLAVAGDGSQEVFRREIDYIRRQFDADYGTRGHSVSLVNSRSTAGERPLATLTSMRAALSTIASSMDRDKDILFLYVTSHGSADHQITLGLTGLQLPGLTPRELASMLKDSGIRWKVVVLSACYAGGFIDELRDPGTLVITAARADRQSFGCADENDFTYFGRAFFKESLPQSDSFEAAFGKAQVLIEQWEARDADRNAAAAGSADAARDSARSAADTRSLPQIDSPPAIGEQLRRWWTQRGPATSPPPSP